MRKISCDACRVRQSDGLCGLPTEEFGEFRQVASRLVFRPRQVVFTEAMPATGLYLVCHGTLKVYHADRFGHEHIVDIVGPGAVLGEFAADHTPLQSVSVEAVTECQLAYLPRERLVPFLKQSPILALKLIEALGRTLAATRIKARDLALKKAESRLAGLLLQLSAGEGASDGDETQVRWRRRDLADMIGVSTETAIRLLSKLKRRGAVRSSGRDVVVCDGAMLAKLATRDDLDA